MTGRHLFRTCRITACASLLVGLWGIGMPRPGMADVSETSEQVDGGTLVTYRMTVTPAPEPDPALRYALVVRESELKEGNAAQHYLRAFPEGGVEATTKELVERYGEEYYEWATMPEGELPLEKMRTAASAFDSMVKNFILPATYRRDCNWGLPLEELSGAELIYLLLPEFQASRQISRALALRARTAIVDGDYERAIAELRMNYRLAQNVGREPLLVCGLVGVAEANIGNRQLIELIAAKDSPNMYWAIAEIPRPLVNTQKAIQFEMDLGMRLLPWLRNPQATGYAAQQWSHVFAKGLGEIQGLYGGEVDASGEQLRWRQAMVTGLAVVMYPHAKKRLIDRGMEAEQVEAMPVGEVLAVDAAYQYKRVADAIEKWTYLPYHIQRKRIDPSPLNVPDPGGWTLGIGHQLAKLLLPAVYAARSAEYRFHWQLGALQTIEAIRMHAAQTNQLPASLDEIDVVPVPLNLATEAPYQYRLEGKTGVLELPMSDGIPSYAMRFEITLAERDSE